MPLLGQDETEVVYAALCEAVRVTDGRYEVRTDGRWQTSATAAAMVAKGLLHADGQAVTATDDAREAAGMMTLRLALRLEVGEQAGTLVCAERHWHGPQQGSPDEVILTTDGRHYRRDGQWCACQRGDLHDMHSEVYFERWTKQGREAHGWLHRVCRRVTQSG